jgi:hypothetical protein
LYVYTSKKHIIIKEKKYDKILFKILKISNLLLLQKIEKSANILQKKDIVKYNCNKNYLKRNAKILKYR